MKKRFSFERKLSFSDVIASVALIVAFLSVLVSNKARQESREAIALTTEERVSIQTSRLIEPYKTEVLNEVEIMGHGTMPHPYFVHAFWDIVVVNNSDHDISIINYSINPLSHDIPSVGPYNASFAQGLFDFQTNMPVSLPVAISSGHFIHLKVRSFIVILPTDTLLSVSKHWEQGLPHDTISIWNLFYDYFAQYGVDFFGNKVSPGPTGINPVQDNGLKNQQLLFRIGTGRGNVYTGILKWY